jgi:hypothetical protein
MTSRTTGVFHVFACILAVAWVEMDSRERVFAVLNHQPPDRIPHLEVRIDALHSELGVSDPYSAYAELGQDAVLLPPQAPAPLASRPRSGFVYECDFPSLSQRRLQNATCCNRSRTERWSRATGVPRRSAGGVG